MLSVVARLYDLENIALVAHNVREIFLASLLLLWGCFAAAAACCWCLLAFFSIFVLVVLGVDKIAVVFGKDFVGVVVVGVVVVGVVVVGVVVGKDLVGVDLILIVTAAATCIRLSYVSYIAFANSVAVAVAIAVGWVPLNILFFYIKILNTL